MKPSLLFQPSGGRMLSSGHDAETCSRIALPLAGEAVFAIAARTVGELTFLPPAPCPQTCRPHGANHLMYCQNCGAVLGQDAKFCQSCGWPQSAVASPPISTTNAAQVSRQDAQPRKRPQSKIVLLIMGGVVLATIAKYESNSMMTSRSQKTEGFLMTTKVSFLPVRWPSSQT